MAGGGITYDGVDAELYGGTIFNGLKFWIAIRVPMRKELVLNVLNNGGEVVKLENQADILIADHARKDTPPGSHSWLFIQNSVKNGQLENVDEFLIRPQASHGRAAKSALPTGSARPPKGVRSPFTQEDDAALMKWVALQGRKGEPISGNKVYQEFAERHPNHSWQSWRDRWIKKLSFLPRPKVGDEDHDNGENKPDDASELPPPSAAARIASQEPNSKVTVAKGVGTKARTPFTEGDDELLRSYVRKCQAKGDSILGNKIYLDFAKQHPHHSYQSWRDRWARHISKRLSPTEISSAQVWAPPPNSSRAPDADQRTAPGPVLSAAISPLLQGDGEDTVPPATNASGEYENRSDRPTTAVSTQKAQDKDQSKKREMTTLAREAEQGAVRDEEAQQERFITSFQARLRGALTRIALRPDDSGSSKSRGRVTPNDATQRELRASVRPRHAPQQATRTESEIFYSDLRDFVQHTKSEVNIWPMVQKRVVNLWDLWSAVRADHHHHVLRNWEQISESLGFDWIEYPNVTRELKKCFEQNLGVFESVINEWNNDEEDKEDEEDEESGDDDTHQENEHLGDEEVPKEAKPTPLRLPTSPEAHHTEPIAAEEVEFTSSPPRIHSLKRRFETELSTPTSRGKRIRHASDSEIPSTPLEKTGNANPPSRHGRSISPSQPTPTQVSNQIESLLQGLSSLHSTQARPEPEDHVPSYQESPIIGATPLPRLPPKPRQVDPIPLSFPSKPHGASSSAARRRALPTGPVTLSDPLGKLVKGRLAAPGRSSAADRLSLPTLLPRQTPKETSSATRPPSSNPVARTKFTNLSRLPPPSQPPPKRTPAPKAQKPRGQPNGVPTPNPPGPVSGANPNSNLLDIVDRFMSMGYPQAIVIRALKATSLVPGEAGLVMESLMAGKELPSRHEGIWTKRDDESLKLVNSTDLTRHTRDPDEVDAKRRAVKERKRLELKHGLERMKARTEFLKAWGAA